VALAVFRIYAVLAVAALAVAVPPLARRMGAPADRALWLILCCPIVAVHVVGGGHNDALSMVLLVAGLALIAGTAGALGLPSAGSGPVRLGGSGSETGPGSAGLAASGTGTGSVGFAGAGAVAGSGSVGSAGGGADAGPVGLPDAGADRALGPPAAGTARPGGLLVAGAVRQVGLLAAGGALVGAAIAVKTTVGVVLPFAALLAAGGLRPGRKGWARFLRRGGAVVGGALAGLLALSIVSGLGLGWATALSGAGESRSWTSPSTAVGIAANAVAKWFGVAIDVVPAARLVALVLMLVALVVIWWRFRRGNPLHGAALACLTVIFCAPITQPWYLFWVLTLLAVTTVRIRWLEIAVVASMFLILPNGDGAWKPMQVPFAFLVTGLVGWVGWRAVQWLRQPAPAEVAVR